ncbi:hypothetical protein Hanom_Chr01g00058711 [Helianthus anomalus]
MLKHRGLEICLETSRMSVLLVVRSRYSVNYDETLTCAKNDPNSATNGIFAFLSLKYTILVITKIFGCPDMVKTLNMQ